MGTHAENEVTRMARFKQFVETNALFECAPIDVKTLSSCSPHLVVARFPQLGWNASYISLRGASRKYGAGGRGSGCAVILQSCMVSKEPSRELHMWVFFHGHLVFGVARIHTGNIGVLQVAKGNVHHLQKSMRVGRTCEGLVQCIVEDMICSIGRKHTPPRSS